MLSSERPPWPAREGPRRAPPSRRGVYSTGVERSRAAAVPRVPSRAASAFRRPANLPLANLRRTMAPESILFEDKDVPCWTFTQLERLSKANLKQRAKPTAPHGTRSLSLSHSCDAASRSLSRRIPWTHDDSHF
jgi:hypothetical protein